MLRFVVVLVAALGSTLGTGLPALAQSAGVALLIANQNYDRLRDATGAQTLLEAVRPLSASGFHVDQATDLSTNALRAALSGLSETLRTGTDERVILAFAGRVVHAAQGAWLLGTEAQVPNLATLDSHGVRLETVMAMAGARQGGAVVVIADMGLAEPLPAGLQAGVPAGLTVPQGVSVVHGAPSAVGAFLRDLMRPGTTVGGALNARPQLAIQGFNPPYAPFLPAAFTPPVDLDAQAWDTARTANTVEAYQAYLDAYPQGAHVPEAQAAMAQLLNTPERIEAALNLTRDERRAIQRDLTLLGYDPRGIDGVFGGGTRSAISAWQGANRYPATSFLNRDQIFDLAQQGARRAAQLEAEARARAAEEERRDRTFWRDTGSGTDEVGLRAYLDRYPQGIFASVARDRLAQIEADRRAALEARDRAAWAQALALNTLAGYQAYARDFPQGLFRTEAAARIRLLSTVVVVPTPGAPFVEEPVTDEPVVAPDLDAARAAEQALRMPLLTRVEVEARLTQLGYEPGLPDGRFDRQTRQAIRQYQTDLGAPVTGFLDERQLTRLMAEGFLQLLR